MNNSTLTIPAEERYFEDYLAGSIHEFGSPHISLRSLPRQGHLRTFRSENFSWC
jgi:hypothetical protein